MRVVSMYMSSDVSEHESSLRVEPGWVVGVVDDTQRDDEDELESCLDVLKLELDKLEISQSDSSLSSEESILHGLLGSRGTECF